MLTPRTAALPQRPPLCKPSRPPEDSAAAEGHPLSEPKFSVIVPIGPGDESWRHLLPDLAPLAESHQVILAAVSPEPNDLALCVRGAGLKCSVIWTHSAPGRAAQMNHAAQLARGSHLWFLHSDSRVPGGGFAALADSVRDCPRALHYFRLRFSRPRPWLMGCNEWGAGFRSRFFRLPFGDQALCLDRELFEQLGGFDEDAPYGEDHLLVWKARRNRTPLRCTGASIYTSSRKYQQRGWAATTARHFWLTWRQALPQALQGWLPSGSKRS